jgi:hypothetical protein
VSLFIRRGWQATERPSLYAARTPTAPWLAWVLALALGVVGAASIVWPLVGVGVAALAVSALVAWRVVRRPFDGLVLAFCVFPLYPIVRGAITAYGVPIPTSGIRFWPELLLCAMFAGIVIGACARRERLRLYWDDLPSVAFVLGGLYSVLVVLRERPLLFAVFGVHFTLVSALFYFAARWSRPGPRDVARIVRVLLVSYALLAFASLLDYVVRPVAIMKISMVMRPPLFWGGLDPFVFWKTYPRMQSLLFEENVWGSMCALVSVFCLASLVQARPPRALKPLFLLSTLCLLLSMSRGAWLCWAASLFVLVLLRGRHRPRVVAACLALLVVAGAALGALRQHPRVMALWDRVERIGVTKGRLTVDRADQWKNGLDAFRMNPSGLGLGTGGNAAVYSGLGQPTVADGHFVKVAMEQGVPGLLTLALCLTGVFWAIVRHLPATDGLEKALGLTLASFLVGMCFHAVGANTLDYDYMPAVFWTLAGLFLARRLEPRGEVPRA